MIPVRRAVSTLLAAASAFALAGCISLLPEAEPSSVYRINHPAAPRADAVAGAPVVSVERPEAARALAGDRIALAYEGGRIAYIANASWASPAPELMRGLVLDALDAHPDVIGARPADGVDSRYDLRLELRAFEARADGGAPTATVILRARLIDQDARRLVGVRVVEARERAAAERTGAIVSAMEAAANRAASETADWLSATIAEDQAREAG
jgi:cholesterol transport system auxiliary component